MYYRPDFSLVYKPTEVKIDMGLESETSIFTPPETEVEKLKRLLVTAEEVEKADKKQQKQHKKFEKKTHERKALAHKTLSDIASGKVTKNAEVRVEAAKAILSNTRIEYMVI